MDYESAALTKHELEGHWYNQALYYYTKNSEC